MPTPSLLIVPKCSRKAAQHQAIFRRPMLTYRRVRVSHGMDQRELEAMNNSATRGAGQSSCWRLGKSLASGVTSFPRAIGIISEAYSPALIVWEHFIFVRLASAL